MAMESSNEGMNMSRSVSCGDGMHKWQNNHMYVTSSYKPNMMNVSILFYFLLACCCTKLNFVIQRNLIIKIKRNLKYRRNQIWSSKRRKLHFMGKKQQLQNIIRTNE